MGEHQLPSLQQLCVRHIVKQFPTETSMRLYLSALNTVENASLHILDILQEAWEMRDELETEFVKITNMEMVFTVETTKRLAPGGEIVERTIGEKRLRVADTDACVTQVSSMKGLVISRSKNHRRPWFLIHEETKN